MLLRASYVLLRVNYLLLRANYVLLRHTYVLITCYLRCRVLKKASIICYLTLALRS